MEPTTNQLTKKNNVVFLHPLSASQKKDDEEVWNRFKEGSSEAFHLIYRKYFSVIFNYGCQFTSDREMVKDLIQDLFIELNERKEKLGKISNLKAYLFTALKRKIFNAKKFMNNSEGFRPDHTAFAVEVSHGMSHEMSYEQELIKKEDKTIREKHLEKAYGKLSKRQREVLLYYFYEGLNYQEISSIMQFSKTEHARKLVYRAVCKLRKIFSNYSIAILILSLLYS